jgi:hypothetical protein
MKQERMGSAATASANQRKTIGEVIAVAREQPHAVFVPPRQDAEAVMLNFVNPIWPRRRLLRQTGQAWLDGGFVTPEHRPHRNSKIAAPSAALAAA